MSARTSKLQPPADGGDKSHTRWIVSLTAAAALLYRRDILMLRLLVGAIGSAVVCKILKRLINKARPASSSLSDPGMPSSHAQALFFFSTYLSWMAREKLAPPNTTLVPSALSLAALLLTARRVQRGHHDVAQVLVGGLLGIVNSTLWYHYSYLILTASDSDPIPTPVIIGIMVIGAAAVGSLERKVRAFLSKKKHEQAAVPSSTHAKQQ